VIGERFVAVVLRPEDPGRAIASDGDGALVNVAAGFGNGDFFAGDAAFNDADDELIAAGGFGEELEVGGLAVPVAGALVAVDAEGEARIGDVSGAVFGSGGGGIIVVALAIGGDLARSGGALDFDRPV